jgi:hypothetical protein
VGLAEVREVVSAGALAWEALLDRPDISQRDLDAFTEKVCSRLVAAREPGTRAAKDQVRTGPDLGLIDVLTAPAGR